MRTALVGREREYRELASALDRAASGSGGALLVAGPAGIGKTRLCEELFDLARARHVPAAWTVCWESVPGLALGPWHDLLAQLGSGIDAAPGSDDPAVARAMRFEQAKSALRDLAGRGPHLLVIDDAQWADPTSLELLGHALGALRGLPILVLLTVRTDLAGGVGSGQIGALARRCEMLVLPPLDDDAIASLATARVGKELADPLRDDLVARAAGNPLFAGELAGLLAGPDTHASAAQMVPQTLRDLLLRPLDDRTGDVRDVLAAVAVAGDHATLDVISASVSAVDKRAVIRCLNEAARVGLVAETSNGRFELHHPLLRTAIVDQLDPVALAMLHERVGNALERRAVHDQTALVALADHRLRAAASGQQTVPVETALRAAEALVAGVAYDQAATLLDRVLAIAGDDITAVDRGELLLALGSARWAAGDPERGHRALLDAAGAATDAKRPDLLARVALALGGPGGFEVRLFDRDQVHLLENALAALGPDDDPALRSWVGARLSVALSLTTSVADRSELADAAVELARTSDDSSALAHALAAWCDVHAGPDHVDARAQAATEIVELARRVRDPAIELLGLRLRVVARLESGDLSGADADIETFARVAAPLKDSRFDWVTALWRAMRALHDGRVDDFLSWNDKVQSLGEQAGSGGAAILAIGQRWLGLMMLGRVDEAVELWAAHNPEQQFAHLGPMMISSIAFANAVAGDTARADQMLDRFALDELAKDSEWLSSLSQLADAIVLTGNRRLAGPVRVALTSYADQWVIDGIGSVIRGPVRQWIDALETLLDEPEATAGGRAANRFELDGDVWTIAFAGDEAHVRDTKGMRDIATLLAHPAQDVRALDLMAGGTATVVQHDTGPALDEAARTAYRRRIEALQHELDAADHDGDADRSRTLQAELDLVADELRRATGLGGRARGQGSSDQRARTAVTGRIKDAIKRIDAVHPRLAEHLRASIRTGTTCSYAPSERIHWQL